MRSLAVLPVLLTMAACGAEGGSSAEEPAPSTPDAPETVAVTGSLRVDVIFGFKIRRNPDRCVADGRKLADSVGDAVIRSADGSEVGLVDVDDSGESPTYTSKGQEYYNTDVCTFLFRASVPRQEGVYTVAWPDLDVEERFTADAATNLRVKFTDD